VGNIIFVARDAPGLTLCGAQHPGEVSNAQGPVPADDKGPEINFWPFPRGSDKHYFHILSIFSKSINVTAKPNIFFDLP
jgi:hypothetical protein